MIATRRQFAAGVGALPQTPEFIALGPTAAGDTMPSMPQRIRQRRSATGALRQAHTAGPGLCASPGLLLLRYRPSISAAGRYALNSGVWGVYRPET